MKDSGFLSQAALCLSAKSRFADYDTRVSDCNDSFWISEVFTFSRLSRNTAHLHRDELTCTEKQVARARLQVAL